MSMVRMIVVSGAPVTLVMFFMVMAGLVSVRLVMLIAMMI